MKYPEAKTAKDMVGNILKVGDTVYPFDIYSKALISDNPVKIIKMHRQGIDGTIIHCSSAPNPIFPFHFTIRAVHTIKKEK